MSVDFLLLTTRVCGLHKLKICLNNVNKISGLYNLERSTGFTLLTLLTEIILNVIVNNDLYNRQGII